MGGSSQILQKYRLVSPIAKGGMGEVYLARQEGPAGFVKTVVVKRILEHLSQDEAFVNMFVNEARLAALLSHQNIVHIFELGVDDGTYFIAMEYIHGRSLRSIRKKLLTRGQLLPAAYACRICIQALRGLHHAHSLTDQDGRPLEIVHRDVTPENILVAFNGLVKLVDFGIAKAAINVSTTRIGAFKGKFAYMSPEQITSGKVDARADIYAMGVVLYEILTGTRPFSANGDPALLDAIVNSPVRPPIELNPQLSPLLNDIIMKSMARLPEDRFETAEELSNALLGFVEATGEKVNNAQIAVLLKDLFGDEAAQNPDVLPTPRPGSRKSDPSIRPETVPLNTADEKVTASAVSSISSEAELDIEENVDLSEFGTFTQAKHLAIRHRPWIGAVALLVLLVGLGIWVIAAGSKNDAPALATLPPKALVTAPPSDAGATDDVALRAYIDEIDKYVKEGRFGPAHDLLQKARQTRSNDPMLNIRLAELTDVVERGALLAKAKSARAAGDVQSASAALKELLARDPENAHALELLHAVSKPSVARVERAEKPVEAEPVSASADIDPDSPSAVAVSALAGPRRSAKTKSLKRDSREKPVANPRTVAMAFEEDAHPVSSPVESYEDVTAPTPAPPAPAAVAAPSPVPHEEEQPSSLETPVRVATQPPTPPPSEVKPPVPTEPPATKTEVSARSPRLPNSFKVRSSSDLLRVFQAVENEAIHIGGVPASVGRNVTLALAEELTGSVMGVGHGVELYPRAMYNLIVSHAKSGEGKSEVSEVLRRAHVQGTLQREAQKPQ